MPLLNCICFLLFVFFTSFASESAIWPQHGHFISLCSVHMKVRCHRITVPPPGRSAVRLKCLLACRMFEVLWQVRTFRICEDVFDISLSKSTVMAYCLIFSSTWPLALYSQSHGMRACHATNKTKHKHNIWFTKNRTVEVNALNKTVFSVFTCVLSSVYAVHVKPGWRHIWYSAGLGLVKPSILNLNVNKGQTKPVHVHFVQSSVLIRFTSSFIYNQ